MLKSRNSVVCPLVLLMCAPSAFANMIHNQHQHMQQINHNFHDNFIRNQQADQARQAHLAMEIKKQQEAKAEAERIAREQQAERERIERENEAIRVENERVQNEINEQKRQIEARRIELDNQRKNGTFSTSNVTIHEILDALRNEKDPEVQEYWATMVVLLDSTNQEAIKFLQEIRGWTEQEIAGLNMNKDEL